MSKPPKNPVPTLANLSAAMGISVRRVSQLKAAGMPTDSLEAAQAWRSSRADDDSASELRRRRIKLLFEQERIAKTKADSADGLLVSRAECEEEWTRIGYAVAAMLARFESELPQICLGLPLEKSLPLVKTRMREIRRIFADGESQFWQGRPTTFL